MLACTADGSYELLDENSQAACIAATSTPREFNTDMDLVIRSLGQGGDACTGGTAQNDCFSYTDLRPVAVGVGDDHASASGLYLCTDVGGGLDNCTPPTPAEYDCEFGGNCTCGGLIDCFLMVWDGNCEPNSLDCDSDGCTCENTDGC